ENRNFHFKLHLNSRIRFNTFYKVPFERPYPRFQQFSCRNRGYIATASYVIARKEVNVLRMNSSLSSRRANCWGDEDFNLLSSYAVNTNAAAPTFQYTP